MQFKYISYSCLLLLLFPLLTHAGIIAKKWTLKGYGTYNVLVYTPDNFKPGTKLPVFVFIPGNGETGTDINKLYTYSTLGFIKNGYKPNFIVVGIQPIQIWPLKSFIKNALDSLKNPIYGVDFNQLYLTGLSGGCQAIWDYMQTSTNTDFVQPAAVLPMSYETSALCGNVYQKTDSLCGNDLRFAKTACWALCGKDDSFFSKMQRYCQLLALKGYNAKFTGYTGGHCCWTTYYDPNFKEAGKNIYDWALQYSLNPGGGTLPVKLLSFTGAYAAGSLKLAWETGSESNNAYFIVEESPDGLNFSEIGRVPTKATDGNSSTNLKYTFSQP